MVEKLVKMALVFQLVSFVGCLEDDPAAGDPETGDPQTIACGSGALYVAEHVGCEAMDATGQGACYCAIGWAWDGEACVGVNGCECLGQDCDSLTQTLEECLAAHEACVEPEPEPEPEPLSCGSEALHAVVHDRCEAMDAAGQGECFCFMGFVWDGEACVGLDGCECVGEDCDSLTETVEECEAAHESCVEPEPVPEPSPFSCGSEALFAAVHDRCDAMDARGDMGCYCFIGWTWDGADCVGVTGCECLGQDCDSLTQSREECLAAHASCGA